MENKLEVLKEDVVSAYNSASEEQKEILEQLFGKAAFRPSDVRDRVKTFEDACEELGEHHAFVAAFRIAEANGAFGSDIVAYLKLRIIVAALNEGWKPQFVAGEWRYYPWFWFYTNQQIENMDEEDRENVCRVVGRAGNNAGAVGGLVYSSAYYVSAGSGASFGSRLAFKTEELAEYAGKQFIEIYRDFMIVLQ